MLDSAAGRAIKRKYRNLFRSREELLAENLTRFRQKLAFAHEHSPYYREICERDGIDPARARPEDLPILTKRDLIENFDRIATDPRVRRDAITAFLQRSRDPAELFAGEFLVVHTSGTSGEVCYVAYRRRDWVRATSNFTRIALPGIRRRVAFVGATGGHYTAVSLAVARPALTARFFYNTRAFNVNLPTADVIREIAAFRPRILVGYAGALRILAEARRRGQFRYRPRVIVSSGEALLPGDRQLVEETFGVRVRNLYASSEHLYMGLDVPRRKGEGMYLLEDDLIFELRDDCTLVTNLFNRTVPLFRYRMDDVLRPAARQGAYGPYLIVETLVGRNEHAPEFVNARGERDTIHPIVLAEFYVRHLTAFQVRLSGPDSFRFLAQLEEGLDEAARAAVEREIDARLRELLAEKGMENVRFAIERVGELPPDPETGKFRLIVPERS